MTSESTPSARIRVMPAALGTSSLVAAAGALILLMIPAGVVRLDVFAVAVVAFTLSLVALSVGHSRVRSRSSRLLAVIPAYAALTILLAPWLIAFVAPQLWAEIIGR